MQALVSGSLRLVVITACAFLVGASSVFGQTFHFSPLADIGVVAGPEPVVSADFNHDNRPDLAVGGSGGVSILLGGGGPPTFFGTISTPPVLSIATGDFNGDRYADLAVVTYQAILVLIGYGNGSFAPQIPAAANRDYRHVAVADYNEDGSEDIIATTPDSVYVVAGDGAGGFRPDVLLYTPPLSIYSVLTADFNADLHADVIIGVRNASVSLVYVVYGTGGTGAPPTVGGISLPVAPSFLAHGDFNEDGWEDLVVAGVALGAPGNFGLATILLNNRSNGFTPAATTGWYGPNGVAAADFDGDGLLDLAVPFSGYDAPLVRALRGDGTGSLVTAAEIIVSSFPSGLAAADLVPGYNPSLAVTEKYRNTIALLANSSQPEYPIADAGPDQRLGERSLVVLDGSRSRDPHYGVLTYHWTQIAGPAVTLTDADSPNPSFVAPEVSRLGDVLTFRLIVDNGVLTSGPDQVNVRLVDVNRSPVADAGPDITVDEGQQATLDGSGSFDVDGDRLFFRWDVVQGWGVTLSDWTSPSPVLTAPEVGREGEVIRLRLTVSDGLTSGTDTVDVTVRNVNRPPVARAGDDLTVDEGTIVGLDGWDSSDPDGDPLTYRWTQIAGPAVDLSTSGSAAWFTAAAPRGGATVTFSLEVSDGQLTATDEVNVTVKFINLAPVADAGADQTVRERSAVTLNAGGSFDPDGDTLTFMWMQVDGPVVALSDPASAAPAFTAPDVFLEPQTLTFEVSVADQDTFATDRVSIVVENLNHAPTADAGPDLTVRAGDLVKLDGSGSTDPDGDPLLYVWNQIGGVPIKQLDQSSYADPVATFTAPEVTAGGEILVFELVVFDPSSETSVDQKTILVRNPVDPPACGAARPTLATLWPVNHKLLSVGIAGVTSEGGEATTLTITGVTQDEPTDGVGDGDTAPDAVIMNDRVLLRAERAGSGNGRVYRVHFTAGNAGGQCSGSVDVVVPLNVRPGAVTIDDGQQFVSAGGDH